MIWNEKKIEEQLYEYYVWNEIDFLFNLKKFPKRLLIWSKMLRHVSWFYQPLFHSTLEGRGHLKMAKAQNFRSLKSCPSNMWGNICTFAFPLEKILFSIKKNSLWFRNSLGKKIAFSFRKKLLLIWKKLPFSSEKYSSHSIF